MSPKTLYGRYLHLRKYWSVLRIQIWDPVLF
jgi:hypothetical protein